MRPYTCLEVAEWAKEVLEANPRPAQPKGLWEHHKHPNGLLDHTLEVVGLVRGMAKYCVADECLEVAAWTHDISKALNLSDGSDHPYRSAEVLEEFLGDMKDEEERTKLKKVIWLVRNHINFENPDYFASKMDNHPWFPELLILISADLMSIGCDLVVP